MSTNTYNTFEEIEKDLKILSLKREINKENVKFSLKRAKTDFYPSNLLSEIKGLLQQYMLSFTVKSLRKFVRLG